MFLHITYIFVQFLLHAAGYFIAIKNVMNPKMIPKNQTDDYKSIN